MHMVPQRIIKAWGIQVALLISLRFERAWGASMRVTHKILNTPHAYAHASRTRITLTHVRSEVKSTVLHLYPSRCVLPTSLLGRGIIHGRSRSGFPAPGQFFIVFFFFFFLVLVLIKLNLFFVYCNNYISLFAFSKKKKT